MSKENEKFNVFTMTKTDKDAPLYSHWSEGLSMFITKNGVTIELDSDEIQQLMRSMPRTVGGSY